MFSARSLNLLRSLVSASVLFAAAVSAAAQPGTLLRASPEEVFADGVAAYKKGDYARAIISFTSFLLSRPNDERAYYNRGIAYYMTADYNSSVRDLSKAIEINTKYTAAYIQRGRAYNKLGSPAKRFNFDLAIKDLSHAITLSPGDAMAFRYRAASYIGINETKKAIADLNRSIELNPKNAEAFYLRGNAKFLTNDHAGADADLRAALRLQPGHSGATSLLKKNTEKQAQARTQKQTRPTQPSTTNAKVVPTGDHLTDGDKYLAAGQPDAAIAAYKRALAQFASANITTPGSVSLFFANQKAATQQKIAKAYFQKGEYQTSMTICGDLQKDLLTQLLAAHRAIDDSKFGSTKYVEIAKSQIDQILMQYDLLESEAKQAESLADGCIDIYSKLDMLDDPKFQRLGIGMGRAMIAELVAGMFGEASQLNFAMLKFCNGNAVTVCGPGSNKNETAKYQKRAFEYVNAGIAMFPNLKKNFARRAEIYRYLGQNTLAAADEAMAKGSD